MLQQKVYVRGAQREEEPLVMVVYNQWMFKTELCNKWQETGACRYGDHCQFAHGIGELCSVIRHPCYKTELQQRLAQLVKIAEQFSVAFYMKMKFVMGKAQSSRQNKGLQQYRHRGKNHKQTRRPPIIELEVDRKPKEGR
ncbi:hypothetical protein OROHE_002751 [Orobanche hederae]